MRRAHIPSAPRRPAGVDPLRVAMLGAGKLLPAERALVRRTVEGAINGLRAGTGDATAHWRTLADFANIAEALADLGICSDVGSRARVRSAQAALGTLARRSGRLGTWTLRYEELAALRDGAWLHGTQIEFCSRSEYERAVREVENRTRAALAGNAARGTEVVEVTR